MPHKFYVDKLDEARRRYKEELDCLRSHRLLMEWVDRIADLWSLNRDWFDSKKDSRGRAVQLAQGGGSYWGYVNLGLWMGPNDRMDLESLGRIFDKAVYNDLFEDNVPCIDAEDGSHRTWKFTVRKGGKLDTGTEKLPSFNIQCWVKDSNHCKVVGTGQFKEITRIECGET